MQPKNYQINTLNVLKKYLETCVTFQDADTAFYQVTKSVYDQGLPYRPVQELPGLPYICLRIPTGGGKTLVACHAVGIAAHAYLQTEQAVVLWLVPSTTILEQTIAALKNPRHPYNQALRTSLGNIAVYNITDALYLSRPVLQTETIIIVSTIQAFRVEDTEGRKVYEAAGQLKPLFDDISIEALKDIERDSAGEVIPSLANVIRMHKPIVIVDEAHNARTSLSFETLARLSPSCIIEFTATPDIDTNPSNVLYTVSAAELKAENMIKLPVFLETKPDWKAVLNDAISTRVNLEDLARKERLETGEYIRPILLIQAEANRAGQERITWDVIEKCLIEDFKIPPKHIAVETGSRRDLENINIQDESCEIRYIITVQALKEGWDCPFAYGLCSVAELHSSTAVEQIIGRILRLPNASPKIYKELNAAYAFSSSANFGAVASALADAMVQNGFERQEAKDLIKDRKTQPGLGFSLPTPSIPTSVTFTETPDFSEVSQNTLNKITYDHKTRTFSLKKNLNKDEIEEIKQAISKPENRDNLDQFFEAVSEYTVQIEASLSLAERGEEFSVPVLAVKEGDLFETFEETHFLEIPWELSKCDPTLAEDLFPIRQAEGQLGEVTVTDTGHVQTNFISALQFQMTLFESDHGWELPQLVLWLDQRIPHPDISGEDAQLFLSKLLLNLTGVQGFSFERLIKEKFRLRNAVAKRIEQHRLENRKKGWQQVLFSEQSLPLSVSANSKFTYDPDPYLYPYNHRYQGQYQFKKHYYPVVGDLKSEGEEFECAQFLDLLPEVKYWVRNLERQPERSFWLQTSTDKFYPDFVCLLNDGRLLVVEYKGAYLYDNEDSKEKRLLGQLWEAKSEGKCLFIMPTKMNYQSIYQKIK